MFSEEKISVVVPVYNEEEAIALTIEEIKDTLEKSKRQYEIIIVNDGSTDGTLKILKKIEYIKLVNHPHNQGYGASLKNGIREAEGGWILIIDADGTYPPKEILQLLPYLKKYDMVIGARIGKNVKVEWYRKPAKWFLSKLANYLSGIKILDLNSGLRAFRKNSIMEFFRLIPSGFSFTVTTTLAYLCSGYSIKYVPIDYYERKGKSKIRPIRDGLGFILLIIRTITYFNPLKVFLPISFLLFLAGLFIGIYSLMILHKLMDVTVLILWLTSLQIAFFGLIADVVVKRS